MPTTTRPRRAYDHRVRQRILAGDEDLARELAIPRSTASSWRARGPRQVVTAGPAARDFDDEDIVLFQARVRVLEQRIRKLRAILRLLVALLHVRGGNLRRGRLPEGRNKARILRAIDRVRGALDLRSAARAVGLSLARFHSWKRAATSCEPADQPCCPRIQPRRLTPAEVSVIHWMVTAIEFSHASIGSLSLLAQRLGKVFASSTTWYRLARKHGWRRPGRRLHPYKRRLGVRAQRANELWHLDTTIIRLLDGTRLYLRGVIDNFSRRILAWELSPGFDPGMTTRLLRACLALLATPAQEKTTVLCDAGSENLNRDVDGLFEAHDSVIARVVAQVDILESNSMIEAFWHRLRHTWLYANPLDTETAVRRLVAEYVHQHNTVLPHFSLEGLTPDEAYFGTGAGIVESLAAGRAAANAARLVENRRATCAICPIPPPGEVTAPTSSQPPPGP